MLITTRELKKMKIDTSNPNYWQVGQEIKFKKPINKGDVICYILAGIVMAANLYILIRGA